VVDALAHSVQPVGVGPKKIETIMRHLADGDATPREIAERSELLRLRRKERLQQMLTYAALTTCRREFLLRYFDDQWGACVNCDNCAANAGDLLPPELSGGTRREVA
jgi:superfamily II DNA helicase RecQ